MNEQESIYIKNKGITEEEILLNRFTSFINVSMRRQKATYLNVKNRQMKNLLVLEDEKLILLPSEFDFVSQIINSNNLEKALKEISIRERYVVICRILEDKDFEEIGNYLGIKYKGAAAIYYRAIAKMRNTMGEK